MGCDIHLYVERREDGKWQSADAWEANPYADYEGERTIEVPYEERFYTGRNYRLFGMLAGVRGGYGITPISDPKGLPEDVTENVKADSDQWDIDGHSHSWLTVRELLDYDWTQTATITGWVNGVNFEAWDRYIRDHKKEPPRGFCSAVGGGRVEHISQGDMRDRITIIKEGLGVPLHHPRFNFALEEALGHVYCKFEIEQPYYKCAAHFLSETIPRLLRLGAPENVRIVFWFDN